MTSINENRLSKAERAASAADLDLQKKVGPPRRPANIVEFILGAGWLHRPGIYPRQLTLLKILTLAVDLLTEFDRKVIKEWSSGFTGDEKTGATWTGSSGTTPDVIDRMERCRAEGRLWFRHPVLVIGRRGGKGHIGALVMAYVLWWFITLPDPRKFFGIAPEKTLAVFVFAANRLQAEDNQAKDLIDIIRSAPCFEPYAIDDGPGRLRLWSHLQLQEGETDPKRAAFQISALPATPRAGRGPAAFMVAFDEVAWMQATGASRSAEEVEDSALPALDQCRPFEFVYSASSPWSQVGRFYENHCRALQVDTVTGEPRHWDMVTFQLASWDLYEDWDHTGPDGLEVAPGRGTFPQLVGPIQAYDDFMRREEEENPETFAVERRGQWASAPTAYFRPDAVRAVFQPWDGRLLAMQDQATDMRFVRFGHADPSSTEKNFALAIGHLERPDPDGLDHIVYDLLKVWRPQDFPGHRIDYIAVEAELGDLMERFRLRQLTVDQFGAGSLLDHLQDHARTLVFTPRTYVFELNETRGSNWIRAEEFKRLLNLGLVHAPSHELAELELLFLQQDGTSVHAPTMGPVQTDDLADAMMTVAVQLSGQERSPHRALRALEPRFGFGANEYAQRFSAAGTSPQRQMLGTMRMTDPRFRRRQR